MYNFYILFFEFGALAAFFWILRREYGNKRLIETLILAFLYGLILEINNTHLSQSYFYNKDFVLQIYGIPLGIAAGWAIVYYATLGIARELRLKWYQSPFFMALMAVVFDLALDPAAVRLGFWSWRIPLDQEWFGVPYDNLLGWMAVVWTFSLFINLSEQSFVGEKKARIIKYASSVISPVLLSLQITIYVTFSALVSGRFTFGEIMEFYRNRDFSYAYVPEVQVWKFYFFTLVFLAFAAYFFRIAVSQGRILHKR